MATKKSTTVVDKENKVDIPQDITKCLFFQRLPYRLTEEQWNFVKAVWDKKNIGVFVNARAGSSKTTLAVGMAMLMAYEYKMYKNIYYIISPCEEAQNYRLHDLKKTLTRIHDDCKAIIIGHDGQVDLKYPADSGFIKYLMAGKSQEFIEVVELTENFRGKLSNWADEVR